MFTHHHSMHSYPAQANHLQPCTLTTTTYHLHHSTIEHLLSLFVSCHVLPTTTVSLTIIEAMSFICHRPYPCPNPLDLHHHFTTPSTILCCSAFSHPPLLATICHSYLHLIIASHNCLNCLSSIDTPQGHTLSNRLRSTRWPAHTPHRANPDPQSREG